MVIKLYKNKCVIRSLIKSIGFLKYILDKNVMKFSKDCPYLIERSMVAILRASIHLIHYDVSSIPINLRNSSDQLSITTLASIPNLNSNPAGGKILRWSILIF